MQYRNETDETLVLLTLAGEQSAYEVLVTRYQSAVISSALSATRSRPLAEDAAQDAFVTAWMKLNTLQEPQKFGSWVCCIARNCALNAVNRYRAFLPYDLVENLPGAEDPAQNPAEWLERTQERTEVNRSVEKLPEKVRQIICLHYFEGLSVSEIADRMRISEGTVKWQLHDGRKRIRKELCAMNEKYTDTLVERVMKKVEELKLWQLKNDKTGFEKVYRDVFREVEELPECSQKHRLLADVLMRGWWWLPGEKNDALFARITEAAIKGKNEEVMSFIVSREDSRVWGAARCQFIREKQIPRLEQAGFLKTLGREWFWLGHQSFRVGKPEEGLAAYDRAEEILGKDDLFRALIPVAKQMEEALSGRYREAPKDHYLVGGTAEEYRVIDGQTRFWTEEGVGEGWLSSVNRIAGDLFRNASCCDGFFFADVAPGKTYVGTDGTKLTYLSDRVTAETPAGRFEGCQLWQVSRWNDTQKIVCRTAFKEGVGIVRQECVTDGTTVVHSLASYRIRGGSGYLPFHAGNRWEYVSDVSPDFVSEELTFSVAFADGERVLLSHWKNVERLRYDETSWFDAVQEISNEYFLTEANGKSHVTDVTRAIERAERLAASPMEKAYTRAAASVARRILATDTTFNPQCTATGHWNFFSRIYLRKQGGRVFQTDYNPRWSFELKHTGTMIPAETPILFNDVLGILQDAANCLWSEEWRIGASPIVEYTRWDQTVRTQITCEDGGTVQTQAGTFENCFKLCMDIAGMEGGWSYRGGKKTYWFAEGIGIVRTENEYCDGTKTAVYELTSYEGRGEGFLPVAGGLMRRYDALDLTDGFVASAEYTFLSDEDGDVVVFEDRTGIRELPPPITQYSAIQGEMTERQLWDAGKWKEAQHRNGVNNFHLLLHFFARPSWNRNNAKRSVEINGCKMRMIEQLGENGEVPPAWYPLYSWMALVRSAALFGNKQKEEGYASLDLALNYCEKYAAFRPGDLLDAGNAELLGGAKLECGKNLLHLPDGTKEAIAYDDFDWHAEDLLRCITAPRGWEWFNSVREEDRFKERVERVRTLAEKE